MFPLNELPMPQVFEQSLFLLIIIASHQRLPFKVKQADHIVFAVVIVCTGQAQSKINK